MKPGINLKKLKINTLMEKCLGVLNLISFAIFVSSCSPSSSEVGSDISTDSVAIARGQIKFSQNCSACHNFKEDGIGPQLGGLTKKVSAGWIKGFVRDPKGMIESGDERSKSLFETFKTIMPSFNYSEEELDRLVAFLNTKKAPDPRKEQLDPNAVKNPIPEPIPMSDIVVNLALYTEIPPSSEEKPLTRITKLEVQPGTKELFLVDLRGKLYHLKKKMSEVYMDMGQLKPNFIHKPGLATGFGSFAFHPEFAKNGIIYTSHTEPPGTAPADFAYADSIKVTLQWVLSEWKTSQPGTIPFVGEGREMLRVNMVSGIHGMQEITFNPLSKKGDADYGMLYVGIGDGGSAENGYPFLCHNPEKIWGTVLRIDPAGRNSPNGKYGIPQDNPFAKSDNNNVNKEIYAYGFRNPHRITWSKAGQLFVSNVGHFNIESLYILQPGSDCGWPVREGTFVIDPSQNMHNIYPRPADDAKNNFTYPVAQYDHDEGNAIAGGFEYTGKALPHLQGKFVFGDIVHGRLFYVEMKDLKLGSQAPIKEWRVSFDGNIKTLKELSGADKVDERFGRDANGELFLTTKPDGKVYRLVSSTLSK
jgi:glucose/arabinose dehydrogenase/mono/diheme cytochrome c family protein